MAKLAGDIVAETLIEKIPLFTNWRLNVSVGKSHVEDVTSMFEVSWEVLFDWFTGKNWHILILKMKYNVSLWFTV